MSALAAPAPWHPDGPPLLMGILNVTPDSFSDGGRFAGAEAAIARGHAMVREGAAILDIGGESTRPGFTPVPADAELARVLPVLDGLREMAVPLSVDTTKAAVARHALAHGATVINDIWGLQADPDMATVVAEAGAWAVVMHNRHAVDEALDVDADIHRFFERSLALASRAGLPAARLALDPGVGFGKTPRQQVEAVLAVPRLLRSFGLPVLVGLSRKSVLKSLTGSALADRLPDTLAAHLAAYRLGARLFRVHDVAAHAAAFTVFSAFTAEASS